MRTIARIVLTAIAVGLPCTLPAAADGAAAGADMPAGFGGPAGRFFSLQTHRLHMVCQGEGQRTVVFEAGLGGSSDDWRDIQAALPTGYRSCAYDRAGYGWSDPGPLPRTSTQIVSELRDLLQLAGEQAPYVLVGHSFGGLIVQEYASRYPEEVAGVVLVESSHPEQEARLGPLLSGGATSATNPIHMPDKAAVAGCRGTDVQSGFLNSRRKAVFAQMQELRNFAGSASGVAELAFPPGVPAVVLSRGLRETPDGPGGEAAEQAWAQLQADLARRTGAGAPRVGVRSGHNLHLCQPELVTRAIEAVAEAR